ncbi:MAG: glycoside hydrolase family 38 C-terminal domain-containing protein, partial [bacterium]
FYWVGPDGNKTLAWLSRDAYTEAWDKWHIDPALAKFFHPELRKQSDMQVMEEGIQNLLDTYAKAGYTRDAVLVEHAFDNLSPEPAYHLLQHIDAWNSAHESPKLVLATPDEFFAHITADPNAKFASYPGNWTAHWERAKTAAPVTQSILRHVRADLPQAELIAAVSPSTAERPDFEMFYRTLMTLDDHGAGPGGAWPKLLTETKMKQNNAEFWTMTQTLMNSIQPVEAKGHSADSTARPDKAELIATGPLIENEFYRIRIDAITGSILSILDKTQNRELVNPKSKWKFGGLVKASNTTDFLGGEPQAVKATPIAVQSSSGRDFVQLEITAGSIKTIIQLKSGERQVHISNEIDTAKLPVASLQDHSDHYYFAFPINIALEQIIPRVVGNGGVMLSPGGADHLPGALGNSLYPHHALALDDEATGFTFAFAMQDSFAAKIGSLNMCEYKPMESAIFVEAFAKTDFADTKDKGAVPLQSEPETTVTSSFVIASGEDITDIKLRRFGQDAVGATLQEAAKPFFTVDAENVEIMTVKTPSFGNPNDLIVRLMELEGMATDATLKTTLHYSKWRVVSGVEADVPASPSGSFSPSPLPTPAPESRVPDSWRSARINLRPHHILTLRLTP